MTVHGAKGLEAPIVILADTTTAAGRARRSISRGCCPAGARPPAPGTPDRLVWMPTKETDIAADRRGARRARAARPSTNIGGCSTSR